MSKGRADHTWAKAQYQKAKKIIFASQSVCGICGRPVDFDKKFPDPWSATIDHIVPVIKGGDRRAWRTSSSRIRIATDRSRPNL